MGEPTQTEILKRKVPVIRMDMTDDDSVSKAFSAPWPSAKISKQPLTVFHSAALIAWKERTAEFMAPYEKINIMGTKRIVDAARDAGASCFIYTSSGSVNQTRAEFLIPPWRKYPKGMFQVLESTHPRGKEPLENFPNCYAYSKARAEQFVRDADDKAAGFRTGCIRPGHAIYANGIERSSSIIWDYLNRGGTPTWLAPLITNFVNAQNVSIAHLAYEDKLIRPGKEDVGGGAYLATDPNPAMVYGDMYKAMLTLAHPLTPPSFPPLNAGVMLILGFMIEAYYIVRQRYLGFLPAFPEDIGNLRPATFNVCSVHLVYDDSKTRRDLGYNAPIPTLEGMCSGILDWNQRVEKKLVKRVAKGEGGEIEQRPTEPMPKTPSV